jgi:4-aminobutyrate aminotransferase-like enzyme
LSVFEDLEKYECRSMHGQLPVVWDKATGFQVFDASGNCWIDFTSTIFVANAGHSHPHIIEELQKLLDTKLLHTYTFANESRSGFLKTLIDFCPDYLEKAFLMSSGTEATECAMKLMRMNGLKRSSTKKILISFKGSMHGRTMGAEMLKGDQKSAYWITNFDPDIHHLPFPYPWSGEEDNSNYDWADHFEKDISSLLSENDLDAKDIAGFIIESYQGWGAIFYPKEYIQSLVKFAKQNDALVVFDEIQSGIGRTGKRFAYEYYGVEPDLVCLGKGLSSSLPLSAVVGTSEIMDLPDIGSMSSTHSGNPLCCAAGKANLEVITSEDLISESERKGYILHEKLNELQKKYPDRVSYIFGNGLVAGILLADPVSGAPDGDTATKIAEKCMQKGLLVVHTGRESIKLGPPLMIPDDALLEGLDVLFEAFSEVVDK